MLLLTVILQACSVQYKTQKAATKMQSFIIDIANTARNTNPNFIVIPQNGLEIAFNQLNPDNDLNNDFLKSINGYHVEELFYNDSLHVDEYRLKMLQKIQTSQKVFVSDYVQNDIDLNNANARNLQQQFIPFVRSQNNYHYTQIPTKINNQHLRSVSNISEVQNYLYLINAENFNSKKEFINAIHQSNYDMVVIDLFFKNEVFTAAEINQLKHKSNGAKRLVLCYMNIGAAEKYRYYWQKNWKLQIPYWLAKPYEGYDDEYWVEFWQKDWKHIIYQKPDAYLHKILNANFDGVVLDNVEAYYFLYNNQ